jgi:hypothetical protein
MLIAPLLRDQTDDARDCAINARGATSPGRLRHQSGVIVAALSTPV